MVKLILNDGTILNVLVNSTMENMKIEDNMTMEQIEALLTRENLQNVKIENLIGIVYGEYHNLEFVSITKYISDGSFSITLKETV